MLVQTQRMLPGSPINTPATYLTLVTSGPCSANRIRYMHNRTPWHPGGNPDEDYAQQAGRHLCSL
ncbi:MAG TPA: hypothetical protein VF043_20950 [Ktedonobacteraceae bacterium]